MEPIAETSLALSYLSRGGDTGLGADLAVITGRAREVVPGLVGFSLALPSQGVTLTYVATSPEAATLDAMQYVEGGPCEAAVSRAERVDLDHAALFDEDVWQFFARASAAAGVESTLSLPFLDGDTVTSGINLYGSRADTFAGRQQELSDLFGAWAPGAVMNGDLSFSSRMRAMAAPRMLEEMDTVDRAVGVLASAQGVSPDEARETLCEAAARAGVPLLSLALQIIDDQG